MSVKLGLDTKSRDEKTTKVAAHSWDTKRSEKKHVKREHA